MFDNSFSVLVIIGVLFGIAMLIYRLQVFLLIFSFFKERKFKGRNKLEENIKDLISQHKQNEEKFDNDILQSISEHPEFHILKIINNKDHLIIYFSNRGGSIFNVEIFSPESETISIEPSEEIKKNSSGCIKIINDKPIVDNIGFEIKYNDRFSEIKKKRYLLSIDGNELKEL